MHSEIKTVLVFANNNRAIRDLKKSLEELGYRIYSSQKLDAMLERVKRENVQVILLDYNLTNVDLLNTFRSIESRFRDRAYQLIILDSINALEVSSVDILENGDDFIPLPVSEHELEIRMRAAFRRLEKLDDIYSEKEFYRQAVRQEEELSSKTIDQNLSLKQANQEIELLNKRLEKANKELERFARVDMLSGLMNRMSLFTVLDEEIERSIRSGMALTGIMLDIDHFKEINDKWGHQCGDRVIRAIGGFLIGKLRKYDHAGRYGGEEFFIVLPHTSIRQGKIIGERFRRDIEKYRISCDDTEIPITASLGVAQFSVDESRDQWISRADKAMYEAKRSGRNCVFCD